jgi:DNA-binding NtrC family response regulator
VVEDDRAVREFVVRSLRQRGYDVVATSSAEEAAQHLQQPNRVFDLLLLDVVLPGQSGPVFLQAIERHSGPVVFMSGYSEHHVQNYRLSQDHPLLEKPFTSDQLLQTIRDALGQAVDRRQSC